MLKSFGKTLSRKLSQRLMELKAAASLDEISHLPPPRCHELTGDRAGQFSVDVSPNYRLVFIPASEKIPTLDDGGIDKTRVTEIEIIGIVDTH